jgi:hypothetical protein
VRAALSRQVFASGEPLGLSVALQNNSSSPLQVTVVLERWVMLRPYPEQPSFQQRFMAATTLYEESVDPQSHWTFDGVRQGVRVPPAYPSFFGDHVGSFASLDPVTFTYTVGGVRQAAWWLGGALLCDDTHVRQPCFLSALVVPSLTVAPALHCVALLFVQSDQRGTSICSHDSCRAESGGPDSASHPAGTPDVERTAALSDLRSTGRPAAACRASGARGTPRVHLRRQR